MSDEGPSEDVASEASIVEENERDLEMLVDVTQKFANIALQKKNQMSMLLMQQQERFRDQLVCIFIHLDVESLLFLEKFVRNVCQNCCL